MTREQEAARLGLELGQRHSQFGDDGRRPYEARLHDWYVNEARAMLEAIAAHARDTAGGMGPLPLDELFPVVGTVEEGAHA